MPDDQGKGSALAKEIWGEIGPTVSDELTPFHCDEDRPGFEGLAHVNGSVFWLASELRECLSMGTMGPMLKAVNRAMAACAELNVPIAENFQETVTEGVGKDWKLSRFACYLAVMNADPTRNRRVAEAQAYFASMTEALRQFAQEPEGVERVVIRGEIIDREKALGSTASTHGVTSYALFQNAGYRGMYNMNLCDIRALRDVPGNRSPLDFMGKTELAANLFRITQTDEKIKQENIQGQRPLEVAARSVGKKVRDTMIQISGTKPEELPVADDIRGLRSGLKTAQKELKKIDGK